MKQEQKSAELEDFLEQEIKKLEHESSQTREDRESSDIIWDAAEAAVALGKSESLTEAANAVINSDAFAHLTDETVAMARRQEVEPEAPEGMIGDFQPDSAIAIEIDEGDQSAGEEADESYLFSAVSSESGGADDEGDLFGGGKPPDDDDSKKDRGARKPKKAKDKTKAKDKAETKTETKGKKRAPKPSGGKPKS